MAVSFEQARQIMREWLAANRPETSIVDGGQEDDQHWLIKTETDFYHARLGDPLWVVNKETGAIEAMTMPREMARYDAMKPIQ